MSFLLKSPQLFIARFSLPAGEGKAPDSPLVCVKRLGGPVRGEGWGGGGILRGHPSSQRLDDDTTGCGETRFNVNKMSQKVVKPQSCRLFGEPPKRTHAAPAAKTPLVTEKRSNDSSSVL